jgi:hypothetical protein
MHPFFDIEDQYHVQTDLWLIASVDVELLALLYEVNQTRDAVEFVKDFPRHLKNAAGSNDWIHEEITSTDRYKRAMDIFQRMPKK